MKKVFVIVTVMAIVCFNTSSSHSAPPYWAWSYGVAGNDTGYSVSQTKHYMVSYRNKQIFYDTSVIRY